MLALLSSQIAKGALTLRSPGASLFEAGHPLRQNESVEVGEYCCHCSSSWEKDGSLRAGDGHLRPELIGIPSRVRDPPDRRVNAGTGEHTWEKTDEGEFPQVIQRNIHGLGSGFARQVLRGRGVRLGYGVFCDDTTMSLERGQGALSILLVIRDFSRPSGQH